MDSVDSSLRERISSQLQFPKGLAERILRLSHQTNRRPPIFGYSSTKPTSPNILLRHATRNPFPLQFPTGRAGTPAPGRLSSSRLACRQERKKPTRSNTRRYSTTSAYSSTSPPAPPGCPSSSHPTPINFRAEPRSGSRPLAPAVYFTARGGENKRGLSVLVSDCGNRVYFPNHQRSHQPEAPNAPQ